MRKTRMPMDIYSSYFSEDTSPGARGGRGRLRGPRGGACHLLIGGGTASAAAAEAVNLIVLDVGRARPRD